MSSVKELARVQARDQITSGDCSSGYLPVDGPTRRALRAGAAPLRASLLVGLRRGHYARAQRVARRQRYESSGPNPPRSATPSRLVGLLERWRR